MKVVAIDDGYASYDQETRLLNAIGASFTLRPVQRNEQLACEAVRDAHLVMVRESPVSGAVIASMPHCRGIVRYGIGVDNIDRDAARERRIVVANVPDYGVEEVSTHAVALLLAVARHLPLHDQLMRSGGWSNGIIKPIYRLAGRKLGLVGYGRIARKTHEKLGGFGFSEVLIHDPRATDLPPGARQATLEEVFSQCDVISLHAPATEQTRHMVNAKLLALARPTAILINTARGSLIETDALVAALKEGRLFGAGLDVYETEPPDRSHPLFTLDNVILTNHIGWYSEEAMQDVQRLAAEEAVRILTGQEARHWLNRW